MGKIFFFLRINQNAYLARTMISDLPSLNDLSKRLELWNVPSWPRRCVKLNQRNASQVEIALTFGER